jgi:hypothetical protein
MRSNSDFIPRPMADATSYGALVHGVISAVGYDPATVGLTDADVAEVGDVVSAYHTLLAEIDALKQTLMAKTKELSGPNGNHQRMVAKLRNIGNKARISDATNAELAKIGVRRKKTSPTPRTISSVAPEFTLDSVVPGFIRLRAREMGSALPRARAANASGLQIAIVDGTAAITEGEADKVPMRYVSRSPFELSSAGMPAKVRLYARWQTQRGDVSGWSLPLLLTVL